MKLAYSLLLLCIPVMLFSCKKKKDEPKFTTAAQITFKNGTSDYVLSASSSWATWAPPGETIGRRIVGDGYSGQVNLFISFDGEVEEGATYQLGTPEAKVSFSDQSLLKMWYSTAGTITITMKDEAHHILHGTFDATVYNDGTVINPHGGYYQYAPSSLDLTNGTFDVHYSE